MIQDSRIHLSSHLSVRQWEDWLPIAHRPPAKGRESDHDMSEAQMSSGLKSSHGLW